MDTTLRRSSRLQEKEKNKTNGNGPKTMDNGEQPPKTLLTMAAGALSEWETKKSKAAIRCLTVPRLLAEELDRRTDVFDAAALEPQQPPRDQDRKKKKDEPPKGANEDWEPMRFRIEGKLIPAQLVGILRNIIADELMRECGLDVDDQPEFDEARLDDDDVPPLRISDICPEQGDEESGAEEPRTVSSPEAASKTPRKQMSIMSSYRREHDDEVIPPLIPEAERFEEVLEQEPLDTDPKLKWDPFSTLPVPLATLTTFRARRQQQIESFKSSGVLQSSSTRATHFPSYHSANSTARRPSEPSSSNAFNPEPEIEFEAVASRKFPTLPMPRTPSPRPPSRSRFRTLESILQKTAAAPEPDATGDTSSSVIAALSNVLHPSTAPESKSSVGVPPDDVVSARLEPITSYLPASSPGSRVSTPRAKNPSDITSHPSTTPEFIHSSGPLHLGDVPLNREFRAMESEDTMTSLIALSLSANNVQMPDSEGDKGAKAPDHLSEKPAVARSYPLLAPAPSNSIIFFSGTERQGSESSLVTPRDSSTWASSKPPTNPSVAFVNHQNLKRPLESLCNTASLTLPKRQALQYGSISRQGGNQNDDNSFYVFNSNVSKEDAGSVETLLRILSQMGFEEIPETDVEILPGIPTLLQNCDKLNITFRAVSPELKMRLNDYLDNANVGQLALESNRVRFGADNWQNYVYLGKIGDDMDNAKARILHLLYKAIPVPDGSSARFTPTAIEVVSGTEEIQRLKFNTICQCETFREILMSIPPKLSNLGRKKFKFLEKSVNVFNVF